MDSRGDTDGDTPCSAVFCDAGEGELAADDESFDVLTPRFLGRTPQSDATHQKNIRTDTFGDIRSIVGAMPSRGNRHSGPTELRGNGVAAYRSGHGFRETVTRVERAATNSGAQLFGRVDYAANAKLVGMSLEPTELLIFLHPKISTPLVQQRRTIVIDLPLKVLVWREQDQTSIAFNAVGQIALRHGVTGHSQAIAAVADWFDTIVQAVTL